MDWFFKQGNGLFVERQKGFAAHPLAFIGNQTVSKVTTSIQRSEACFNNMRIHFDVRSHDQSFNGSHCICRRQPVHLALHPGNFAQTGQRNDNDLRFSQ